MSNVKRTQLANIAARVSLVSMAMWVGCSADSPTALPPIVHAHVLSNAQAKTAIIKHDSLVFPSAGNDSLMDTTGEALASGYGAGFLRRVTSVDSDGTSIMVHTKDVEITEVVEQGAVDTTYDLETGTQQTTGDLPESSPQGPSGGGNPSFDFDLTGKEIWVDPVAGINVRFSSGHIKFAPKLDLGFEVEGFHAKRARAVARGEFSADLQVEGEFATALQEKKERTIWEQNVGHLVTPIGPLPIVWTAKIALKAGVDVGAEGRINVHMGGSQTTNVAIGAELADGAWKSVTTFEPTWTAGEPTLGAAGKLTARVYLRAEITVSAYAVATASLTVGAEPYLAFAAPATDAPWSLDAGVHADINARLNWLFGSSEKNLPLFDKTWRLAPAEGAMDPLPVAPSSCSDGMEDGVETGADCGEACAMGCGTGAGCVNDADCTSGTCVSGTCSPTSCGDGSADPGETGVDCGGSCLKCDADACTQDGECKGGNCQEGTCRGSLLCSDGERDGDETDIDCGGSCAPCNDGQTPLNCDDGVQNGDETDIDCGGSCAACPGGGTGGAGGGGGGSMSTGGVTTCDGSGQCGSCQTCALAGACMSFDDACTSNAECAGLDNCLNPCGNDQACSDACYASYPGGATDYDNLVSCLYCTECPIDCNGPASGCP